MENMVTMRLHAALDISGSEDRETVAGILAKNGYTVSFGKRKAPTGRSNIYTIEVYVRNGEKENGD